MSHNTQSFEQLKQKYQPALNLMQQLKVQILDINIEGSKLFIRCVAPSPAAKNQVWNQIKLIDASYSDLICDISVSQSHAPAAMSAGASLGGGQQQRRYTVRRGDTLAEISRVFYSDPLQYMKIYNANRDVLKNPDSIRPGQELVIPE